MEQIIAHLPLVVLFIGLLLYALDKYPKLQWIGQTMFWVGLLAFLLK